MKTDTTPSEPQDTPHSVPSTQRINDLLVYSDGQTRTKTALVPEPAETLTHKINSTRVLAPTKRVMLYYDLLDSNNEKVGERMLDLAPGRPENDKFWARMGNSQENLDNAWADAVFTAGRDAGYIPPADETTAINPEDEPLARLDQDV